MYASSYALIVGELTPGAIYPRKVSIHILRHRKLHTLEARPRKRHRVAHKEGMLCPPRTQGVVILATRVYETYEPK